jgi:hypothetical protein
MGNLEVMIKFNHMALELHVFLPDKANSCKPDTEAAVIEQNAIDPDCLWPMYDIHHHLQHPPQIYQCR